MPNFNDIFNLAVNNPLITLLSGFSLTFFILYFWQVFENLRITKTPIKVLEENKLKSYDILHDAVLKAQNIIGSADLEAVKIMSDSKLRSSNLGEKYETSMGEIAATEKAAVERATRDFQNYINSLGTNVDQSVNKSQELVQQRINTLFEKFEENLSAYMTQTQTQSTEAIELEMRSARQLIESYKTEQFKLIDENIVAMLERTLSLVLLKKLDLKDQTDLVYESLEKAKAEKFIL